MGEVLKSFFNFTGISFRFIIWFTTLVIAPVTTWFWGIDQDVNFLKSASAAHDVKINNIEAARIDDTKELTKEMKEIQRALGRIEGALGTK